MIDVNQISGTNIVEMFVEGKASAEEFEAALQILKAVITEYGSIRVLEVIGDLDMPPIPWSKFWEDLKFGFEHLSDMTHVAVVADQRWITASVKALNPLLKADIRVFEHADIEQARDWLANAA